MPLMTALKEIRYGGRTVNAGEAFDALDGHVRILAGLKKAEMTPAAPAPAAQKPVRRRAMLPADPVEVAAAPVPDATPDDPVAATPPPVSATPPAGRYARRDLRPLDEPEAG